MRVFLLGTLSAILLGLLVGGGTLVRARRGHVAVPLPEVAEDDVPVASGAASVVRRREPLPAVGVAGCAPRAGWACWRGRLRLSAEVVRGWRARRAVEGVLSSTGDVADGAESARQATGSSGDSPADEVGPDDVGDSDDEAELLPPDRDFRAFFVVRLFRTDDGDDTADTDDVADGGAAAVTLHDDGAFEVHAPPGRYGLEATSRDSYLAGGRDALIAVAGDVQDGLDIVLAPTVVLAGRVVDEDGVLVPSMVTVAPVGGDGMTETMGDGTFRFDDLRPGPYRITAQAGENRATTATAFAPLENLVLHVPRASAGLLILPPGPDGRCGRARVLATPHRADAAASATSLAGAITAARWRRMPTAGCQAVIEPAAPGSGWDVLVTGLETRPIEAQVQFGFGAPVAPVCLRAGCPTDTAALQLISIDVEGRDVAATATVSASGPGGPATGSIVQHLTAGLPANQGLTVEVRAGTSALTRQVWLLPGLNRVVVQFPRPAAALTDGDEAELQ